MQIKCEFSRPIWLGTIFSFRRNNQGTLLPYHECSRHQDITQRLKVVPSEVTCCDIAGDYFQALRNAVNSARPGDRLNGFKNGKTQLFNPREVIQMSLIPKKVECSFNS